MIAEAKAEVTEEVEDGKEEDEEEEAENALVSVIRSEMWLHMDRSLARVATVVGLKFLYNFLKMIFKYYHHSFSIQLFSLSIVHFFYTKMQTH